MQLHGELYLKGSGNKWSRENSYLTSVDVLFIISLMETKLFPCLKSDIDDEDIILKLSDLVAILCFKRAREGVASAP